MPLQILHHADQHHDPHDPFASGVITMAWIAVFYLLRPGEYCKSHDNKPILSRHITLKIGDRVLDTMRCPPMELLQATSSSITFDDQKNRERGEVIAHALSGHTRACPTKALAQRLYYLRCNGGSPDTPLCAVRHQRKWIYITSSSITTTLQVSAAALPHLGFPARQITARSMRAGGAMALLCGCFSSTDPIFSCDVTIPRRPVIVCPLPVVQTNLIRLLSLLTTQLINLLSCSY
jgi:hypothetical protein